MPFSSTNQPDRSKATDAQRANRSVKQALLNAFDTLGNEAFFVRLGQGSAEDKRCLANILAKLLPIEVAGSLDVGLTVTVVTQMGDKQIPVEPYNALTAWKKRQEALPSPPAASAPVTIDG